MNKKGFTLIELLAVIVVLAIVTVLATRSILPFMANSRVDAFKIEATHVIKSAEEALSLLNLNQISLKENDQSCSKGNEICFSVSELINLGLYDGDADTYQGKVLIDVNDSAKPSYTLYLQKSNEFNINGSTETDYVNNDDDIVSGGWTTSANQNKCVCTE